MEWKKGNITFDDGSCYPGEILLSDDGEIWNTRIYKDNHVVEEIDADRFADTLGKSVAEVYPYTCEIKE